MSFILLVAIAVCFVLVNSRTRKDEMDELQLGDAKVILGAYLGDVSIIRLGRNEGGSINPISNKFLGEEIVKLGKAGLDFPVCPAIHLTINQGKKEHLEAAFFLINNGADANSFSMPGAMNNQHDGFPPAILYALGLGRQPTNSHSALLTRLHQSLPKMLNRTSLNSWISISGNPPLTHVAIMNNFFDGFFVLTNSMEFSVMEKDKDGITPLHLGLMLFTLAAVTITVVTVVTVL